MERDIRILQSIPPELLPHVIFQNEWDEENNANTADLDIDVLVEIVDMQQDAQINLDPESIAEVDKPPVEVSESKKSRSAYSDGTPLGIYLREIAQNPLLTAEEEFKFAKEREAGLLAQEKLRENQARQVIYDPRKEELEADVARGKEVAIKLTESNLRLVVSIARKYMGRGLPLQDLIQEGSIGLMRAVEKYDWRKGYRFSTYAYWWIRQAVSRSIADQSRTVRVPVHMIDTISSVGRTHTALQHRLGRTPTDAEWADEAGISVERLREVMRSVKQPVSLETPVGEDEKTILADFIQDRNAIDLEQAGEQALLEDQLEDVMGVLTEREQEVLRLRFGLHGGYPHTLGEIGEQLGVSRERVRQLEAEALAKLRRPNNATRLREYLE